MKQLATAALFLAGLLAASGAASAQTLDPSAWDRVLKKFVTEDGRVDYAGLKANPADLNQFVSAIAARSPVSNSQEFPTRESQLAYWINAYNALVVKGVVDYWPVRSVREIGTLPFSFFWHKKFSVGGHEMTLNDIEGILRKQLAEPRIHFAIVCASISCPHLGREAYTAENADRLLNEAARKFINEPRNLAIDAAHNRVTLSRIFKWYRSDFEAYVRGNGLASADDPVLAYIRLDAHAAPRRALDALRHPRIEYFPYNWGINSLRPPS